MIRTLIPPKYVSVEAYMRGTITDPPHFADSARLKTDYQARDKIVKAMEAGGIDPFRKDRKNLSKLCINDPQKPRPEPSQVHNGKPFYNTTSANNELNTMIVYTEIYVVKAHLITVLGPVYAAGSSIFKIKRENLTFRKRLSKVVKRVREQGIEVFYQKIETSHFMNRNQKLSNLHAHILVEIETATTLTGLPCVEDLDVKLHTNSNAQPTMEDTLELCRYLCKDKNGSDGTTILTGHEIDRLARATRGLKTSAKLGGLLRWNARFCVNHRMVVYNSNGQLTRALLPVVPFAPPVIEDKVSHLEGIYNGYMNAVISNVNIDKSTGKCRHLLEILADPINRAQARKWNITGSYLNSRHQKPLYPLIEYPNSASDLPSNVTTTRGLCGNLFGSLANFQAPNPKSVKNSTSQLSNSAVQSSAQNPPGVP